VNRARLRALAEILPDKGGFGSLGGSQRTIKDFLRSVTADATAELFDLSGLPNESPYLDYDIRMLSNGGSARTTGREFAYHQQLFFFPSWARGSAGFCRRQQASPPRRFPGGFLRFRAE
jgi:hypothetical protein